MKLQKITPFLWFDQQAEEAAAFYTSIFPDSKITNVTRFAESSHGVAGTVMTVAFELAGRSFVGLNGGPMFRFTEAISLAIQCDTQAEIDHYWERLCDGGQEVECGWLKDRFGLSWQVVPTVFLELFGDHDPGKAERAMKAVLKMKKIDIAAVLQAANAS